MKKLKKVESGIAALKKIAGYVRDNYGDRPFSARCFEAADTLLDKYQQHGANRPGSIVWAVDWEGQSSLMIDGAFVSVRKNGREFFRPNWNFWQKDNFAFLPDGRVDEPAEYTTRPTYAEVCAAIDAILRADEIRGGKPFADEFASAFDMAV